MSACARNASAFRPHRLRVMSRVTSRHGYPSAQPPARAAAHWAPRSSADKCPRLFLGRASEACCLRTIFHSDEFERDIRNRGLQLDCVVADRLQVFIGVDSLYLDGRTFRRMFDSGIRSRLSGRQNQDLLEGARSAVVVGVFRNRHARRRSGRCRRLAGRLVVAARGKLRRHQSANNNHGYFHQGDPFLGLSDCIIRPRPLTKPSGGWEANRYRIATAPCLGHLCVIHEPCLHRASTGLAPCVQRALNGRSNPHHRNLRWSAVGHRASSKAGPVPAWVVPGHCLGCADRGCLLAASGSFERQNFRPHGNEERGSREFFDPLMLHHRSVRQCPRTGRPWRRLPSWRRMLTHALPECWLRLARVAAPTGGRENDAAHVRSPSTAERRALGCAAFAAWFSE